MNPFFLNKKPAGMVRLLLRLPIFLYERHLGWLLGHRFLLLTHRGRKTGQLRQALLEVIHYDPRTQTSIVLSAWGARAEWYRNLQAAPAVEVQTGFLRYAPRQHFLSPTEAQAVYRTWRRRHPVTAWIAPAVLGPPGARRLGGPSAFIATLPMVAFRPGAPYRTGF
jgi:deazaflavin-dependent oxidoreductase (nitroreductase family)